MRTRKLGSCCAQLASAGGLALLLACTGTIQEGGSASSKGGESEPVDGSGGRGGGGPDVTPTTPCKALASGPSPLRRLTQREYDNTVTDLLGVTRDLEREFPQDERAGAFYSNASETPGEAAIDMYQVAAETLAAKSAPGLWKKAGCPATDEPCLQGWLTSFGLRAFRRPLETAELDAYVALFRGAAPSGFSEAGLKLVLQTMLQSPHFLYHLEDHETKPGAATAPLTPHALAARLSYFLWQTAPDAELLKAADEGRLGDAQEITRQVRRLIDSPRARATMVHVIEQWLSLDDLDTTQLDPATFPLYTQAMKQAMRQESQDFIAHVLANESGSVKSLFEAPYSIVNPTVAKLYGVEQSSTGQVNFDSEQRMGILTHPSLLTVTHGPVLRGKLIRTRLLCEDIPPPPDSVDTTLPTFKEGQTPRERLLAHSESPTCKGCHELMDPLGFAFDHYDELGRWRKTYGSDQAIDARGDLILGDRKLKFDGAKNLIEQLVQTEELGACVGKQVLRFALARLETEADACTIHKAQEALKRHGNNILEMAADIATSQEFAHVQVQQ